MEAGNRCFDDRVPEEVNRRVIDHSSDVLMPYTNRSRDNLLREGIHPSRILVTGNPIKEVMDHHAEQIDCLAAPSAISALEAGGYLLLTVHRQETVDVERAPPVPAPRALSRAPRTLGLPLVFSVHPRTRSRLEPFGIDPRRRRACAPSSRSASSTSSRSSATPACVLTDSGTVQEECCIMGVPTVTVRDTTERPETIECGSNVLSGVEPGGDRALPAT